MGVGAYLIGVCVCVGVFDRCVCVVCGMCVYDRCLCVVWAYLIRVCGRM